MNSRMKCQFCQAPCFLLREGDRDYRDDRMVWECRNHGSFWVRHFVYLHRRHVRGLKGTKREWHHTTVSWLKGKGSTGVIYRAYYHRMYDPYSVGGEEVSEPNHFRVTIETAMSRAKNKKDWRVNKESEAISMDEWPTWTMKQLPSKVETFIVFS